MSFCPSCSQPLEPRAAVCPHCGYDFPTAPASESSRIHWAAVVFGVIWFAGGIGVLVFREPGAAPWFLAAFGITAGGASFLAGVRPLLSPEAARLASPLLLLLAILATSSAIACIYLGEWNVAPFLWLILITGQLVYKGVRTLLPSRAGLK